MSGPEKEHAAAPEGTGAPSPARETERLGVSGRIARYFQSAQLTPLLALVALLVGLFAVFVTPREEEPQIDVTMANVLIQFPGASVEDVESMVALPAEQVLSQIAGIEHSYSVSRPGIAVLTVQFEVGVPRSEAVVRLHDVLQANQDWLPKGLGVMPPVVKPRGIDDVPIVTLSLHGRDDSQGAADLERVAHAMEAELKRVAGVREVATIGGPGRVVRVEPDIQKLNAYSVTLAELRARWRRPTSGSRSGTRSAGMPASAIETGDFLASATEVAELLVAVRAGKPIYVRDLAKVDRRAAFALALRLARRRGAGRRRQRPHGQAPVDHDVRDEEARRERRRRRRARGRAAGGAAQHGDSRRGDGRSHPRLRRHGRARRRPR